MGAPARDGERPWCNHVRPRPPLLTKPDLSEVYEDRASLPTALYGAVLLLAAIAYTILVQVIIAHQGEHSKLRAAIGDDRKGMISMALYVAAVPLAFVHRSISWAIFVTVALIWLALWGLL